ncbi:MAG: SCO family protein [Gammaproteobacteria bacterium]|nr:SCO family protein [Gammaproteobacteria bacterium]
MSHRTSFAAAVLLGTMAAGCMGEDPEALRAQGIYILPEPTEVTDFALETQDGETFGAERLAGEWSYLFFGFTRCPHLCPTTLATLAEAEERIRVLPQGDQFRGLFISVDPERDGNEDIKAYLARFSDRFTGLRGSRSETLKIARDVDVAFATLPDGQGGLTVEHSGHIVLIDPEGRYRGFIKSPHRVDALVSAWRWLTG